MGSCKSETPPVRMTNQEKRDPAKRVSLPSFLPGEQKHGLHDKQRNENGEKRRWNLPAKRQYIDDKRTGTKHSTFVVALRQSVSVSLGCTQPLSRRRERVNERQRERERARQWEWICVLNGGFVFRCGKKHLRANSKPLIWTSRIVY